MGSPSEDELLALLDREGARRPAPEEPALRVELFLSDWGMRPGRVKTGMVTEVYAMYLDWHRANLQGEAATPQQFVRAMVRAGFGKVYNYRGRLAYGMHRECAKRVRLWLAEHIPTEEFRSWFAEQFTRRPKVETPESYRSHQAPDRLFTHDS